MQLAHRDLSIIQHVSRFGQLSTTHITQLIFANSLSQTTTTRALSRLVDDRCLALVGRPQRGGYRGGSAVNVYQLGLEGHKLCRDGRWIPSRAINLHSLAIADCHVMIDRLAREGKLKIAGYLTERDGDCHITIGKYELKPDLYEELTRPDGSSPLNLMVEIDMGTQGQRQITEKLVRYWNAYGLNDDRWPAHQIVVFVAIDDVRAGELRWILDKGAPEQRAIFKVHTLTSLEAMLS